MSIFRFLLYLNISFFVSGAAWLPVYAAEDGPASGKELYHDYCSVCHGDRGDGNSRARDGLVTKPRDFTQPGLKEILTREQIVHVILNGRPGTAMVGWKTRLSQEQAESIADYIIDAFMTQDAPDSKKGADGAEADSGAIHSTIVMDQPMPFGLTGNPESGKEFYNENCYTCHGIDGAGDGPRAYFIFPKPRNFLSEDSRNRLNRPALFYATKYGIRGKEMPAWGKVIDDQKIADVAEYVFSNFIQESVE